MMENSSEVNMILAGDVGGTKTLLGFFDPRPARPHPLLVRSFATDQYPDLTAILSVLLADPAAREMSVEAACFGVAGPVVGAAADLTNVQFHIDANEIAPLVGTTRVLLVNDLQAMAHSVSVLGDADVYTLQKGSAVAGGNRAVIAAGTGLGQAILHNVSGRFMPLPTEAGHADWAARNDREIEILRVLLRRFGHAAVERVVSGPGLVNLHGITHDGPCSAIAGDLARLDPAAISNAALAHRCAGCVEALDIFVQAYGAEAGNLALRALATGGVFVGGGIAPKILPALSDGRFVAAFQDKSAYRSLLAEIPIKVILNADAGLLGAAVAARG